MIEPAMFGLEAGYIQSYELKEDEHGDFGVNWNASLDKGAVADIVEITIQGTECAVSFWGSTTR